MWEPGSSGGRAAAAAASPPRTINATSSTHPGMAVLPRAPPRGQPSWEGHCCGWFTWRLGSLRVPASLWAVPARSWRAPLRREALGEPRAGSATSLFAWFAWVQRELESRPGWLFGFVGCVGQRLGTRRRRLWDCLVRPRARWRGRGLQGQVSSCPSLFVLHGQTAPRSPSPSPPCAAPCRSAACRGVLSSLCCGVLLVEFHFFSVG